MEEVVTPGQVLTKDLSFMRGHGTFVQSNQLVASVAGKLTRVNKLISIKPIKTRFNGDIGDVVVGRIIESGKRQWKVDIKSRQNATLMLAAINLPGLVQRRKTEDDYSEMNLYFKKGDLVSAEVQTIKDGGLNLHTRSLKYGKLKNGTMVVVPSVLIKKSKSHFLSIGQVDVILGMNGYLWVSKHAPQGQNTEDLYSDQNLPFTIEEREEISKVCNVLRILGSEGVMIDESIIVYMIEAAAEMSSFDILANKDYLIQYALEKIDETI